MVVPSGSEIGPVPGEGGLPGESPLPGAASRPVTGYTKPGDHPGGNAPPPAELAALLAELALAREEMRSGRQSPVNAPRLDAARARLLQALEAYAQGLSARHLPLPRAVHDDLRLLRGFRSGSALWDRGRPSPRTWSQGPRPGGVPGVEGR